MQVGLLCIPSLTKDHKYQIEVYRTLKEQLVEYDVIHQVPGGKVKIPGGRGRGRFSGIHVHVYLPKMKIYACNV